MRLDWDWAWGQFRDAKLYKKYKLTREEIAFIESMCKNGKLTAYGRRMAKLMDKAIAEFKRGGCDWERLDPLVREVKDKTSAWIRRIHPEYSLGPDPRISDGTGVGCAWA